MNDIERLKKTVCDLHGCDSAHAASIAIHETFQGETAWQGIVEVFFLVNHPQAKKAYAWTYRNEVGELRDVAVLDVPPINSAVDAGAGLHSCGKAETILTTSARSLLTHSLRSRHMLAGSSVG
jgi:hypothetical protein